MCSVRERLSVGCSLRSTSPLDLEVVDHGDHRARRDPQPLADRVLGLAVERLDGPHQGELARLEVDLGHELCESGRGLESELGKQEADRLRRPGSVSASLQRPRRDRGSVPGSTPTE